MRKHIFISLMLVFALFLTSCAGVNTTEILKVGDSVATVPEFIYYLRTVGMSAATNNAQQVGQTLSTEDDWETVEIDGVSAKQYAKDEALRQLEQVMAFEAMGKKVGFELPDAEKTLKEQREASIANLGGIYEYKSTLEMIGIDEQSYNTLIERAVYAQEYQKVYVEENKETYEVTDDEVFAGYNEDYITVKHILIKTTDENGNSIYDDAKAKAEEIKEAIDGGANFDALQNEHSEDGRTEDGNIAKNSYTFNKDGGYVQEFKDAGFKLKVGEVSGLVESGYGFHIMTRIENPTSGQDYDSAIAEQKARMQENVLNDLVNKWMNEFGFTVNTKAFDKVKVTA